MHWKLIASDLDGTLLLPGGKIGAYTTRILGDAVASGTEFVICTGRMFDSLKFILPSLPFCQWAVTCNGAELYSRQGERKAAFPAPGTPMRELLRFAEENGLHSQVYSHNRLLTEKWDSWCEIYEKATTSRATVVGAPLSGLPEDTEIVKAVLMLDEPVRNRLLPLLQQRFEGRLYVTSSSPFLIECMGPGVGKATALSGLQKLRQVSPAETLVFGDSENDMDMLSRGGFSFAVANAVPAVRQIVNGICESNLDQGVARTVERLVLGRNCSVREEEFDG